MTNEHTARAASTMEANGQGRDSDGKYNHAFDRMCKCGRTKGEHMAARPYDLDDGDHQCPGFRAVRKVK